MKHVIIGTAGHVDHGKTLLVKALTGIDTDRLAEEKKRGITIELGFAHLDFEDGSRAGIVDVPGHEKFIKNMLAGAGGIDLAMLIVAADEGFMPQTVEHLDILSLLGIRDGIIVITKCDMVDAEWIEMVKEDARERVKGTFLEGKDIMCVSAYTGEGIAQLREKLHSLVLNAQEKNLRSPFRLPIDRVFSIDGFGTVVTGTLIEGAVSVGEWAEVLPTGIKARIRNLQVHGNDAQTAYAGQRVAVNLAGLKRSELERGDTLARPDSVKTSLMLDVRLQNLKHSGREILTGSQLHLYHGSSVRLCKAVLLDRDALHPGESCYAQLRMTQELSAKRGDRFVVRFYSPLETIGGGVILDENPFRHKRGDARVLEALKIRESGSEDTKLAQIVAERGLDMPSLADLCAETGEDGEALGGALLALCSDGRLLEPVEGRYVAGSVFDRLRDDCAALLGAYHARNPLHAGMKTAELRQKLLKGMERSRADALLSCLAREGVITFGAERCALADFEVRLTRRQTAIRDRLMSIYDAAGLEAPSTDEVTAKFSPAEQEDCKRVLESLVSGGGLVMLSPQICICRSFYVSACRAVAESISESGEVTLAALRDRLGTSRKYALALLEYLDRGKVLRKDGDIRRPGINYADIEAETEKEDL